MARKAGDPKVRYIGFRLDSPEPIKRRALIEAIRRTGADRPGYTAAEPWLTRYDGTLGILRCHHVGLETTRGILDDLKEAPGTDGNVQITVKTVGTAGTIRALVAKHMPDLRDEGKRR